MDAVTRNFALALCCGLVLCGCSAPEALRPAAPVATGTIAVAGDKASASARPVSPGAGVANAADAGVAALNDPNNILSGRSIYFEYDRAELKPASVPLVLAHARYMQAHPGARAIIQGNADERGSREYNLALGQRRSDTVARMMRLEGVREQQLEAVSFGEEQPRASGHEESAWAQNRRCDILYSQLR